MAAAGAGFELPAQGSRAAGVGGAFVAQADDPSAVFYNVAGLALAENEKRLSVGLAVLSLNESQYRGLPPGQGAGTVGEQNAWTLLPVHAYWVKPLGESLVFGVGLFQPFGLRTEWTSADSFAGRDVALDAELTAFDLNPGLALKLSPRLAVGAGLVLQASEISLTRRLPGSNPLTGEEQDFATVAVDGDLETGLGWNLGALLRLGERFAVGLAYRSAIEVDYSGAGRLTQVLTGDAQVDDLIAASFPFGQDLAAETGVDFPDRLSVGAAFDLTRNLTVEADVNWIGWSGFEALTVRFPNDPTFDQTILLELEDTMTYRLGVRLATASQFELRFGYAAEESPQPDRTVGPLLADADADVYSVGLGRDWLDVAFTWIDRGSRTVTTNVDGVNGAWESTAWLLSLTISP